MNVHVDVAVGGEQESIALSPQQKAIDAFYDDDGLWVIIWTKGAHTWVEKYEVGFHPVAYRGADDATPSLKIVA